MAKTDEIKIGDVVRLNSDGPKMTVTYVGLAADADVAWIDKGTKNRASYPVVCLTKVSA
jgi:uncharacterized protein YodC (DUF2158 family)